MTGTAISPSYHETETVDELRAFDLRIVQPAAGYRFSLDPLLLAAFAGAHDGERVVDLGTGCGVIPLVLARRMDGGSLVGVESDPVMADCARRNVGLNGLDGRVAIEESDILDLKGRLPASGYDLVVANPPYRKAGTGKKSPRAGRDVARHESTAGLAEFLGTAKRLVALAGRICFIYHPSRLGELMACSAELKLGILRLRFVHGSWDADARMVLIEMVKGRKGEARVQPPLLVYGDDGVYSTEMECIVRGEAC
jgi:tRNA1Val (adenine37-N6)-methyltransferase